jgi:hypothetical protein
MYPCAKPNPDRNTARTYSSHEKDLAEEALITPATISRKTAQAAKNVAAESMPTLVILVYQYRIFRTAIVRPRMMLLVISQVNEGSDMERLALKDR